MISQICKYDGYFPRGIPTGFLDDDCKKYRHVIKHQFNNSVRNQIKRNVELMYTTLDQRKPKIIFT